MENAHDAVAQVIGEAVIQVIADGEVVMSETIARMIEMLYIDDRGDLAVEFALDLLRR